MQNSAVHERDREKGNRAMCNGGRGRVRWRGSNAWRRAMYDGGGALYDGGGTLYDGGGTLYDGGRTDGRGNV